MSAEVTLTVQGRMGRITLNRPSALNALTLDMIRAIRRALEQLKREASVRVVVLDAEGPKAFCAGGDVAALYAAGLAGDEALPRQFWAEEYALDDMIAGFDRPVISLVHGFCMGGGVGLACHARHRVLGETARIAMPECAIGLVPDVGGSALLARAPAGIGPWMALTGARLEPGQAIAAGFADVFIPEAQWTALRTALAETGDPAVLQRFAEPAPLAALPGVALRAAFSATTVPGILKALDHCEGPEARKAQEAMEKASPLALATALELQRRLVDAAGGLRDALRLEYCAVQRALKHGDFLEGVRARIIDRDNAPHWRHASIAAVSPADVAAQLAPIAGDRLIFGDEAASREAMQ